MVRTIAAAVQNEANRTQRTGRPFMCAFPRQRECQSDLPVVVEVSLIYDKIAVIHSGRGNTHIFLRLPAPRRDASP